METDCINWVEFALPVPKAKRLIPTNLALNEAVIRSSVLSDPTKRTIALLTFWRPLLLKLLTATLTAFPMLLFELQGAMNGLILLIRARALLTLLVKGTET